MEASTLHAPALSRLGIPAALLRLRADEQLVALFRAGSEDAFSVIHDRYRQRLFAYVRQMLSAGSRQDAEDVLQDVFMRAYGALRSDDRAVNLRAWLYRVAHNRCIDHLRRPAPPEREIFEMSRRPLHDPIVEAQRREDLQRLVADVGRLPDQQRSALLMREIDGLAYADIAVALDVTVPAVKSLLVRARVGLVEAIEARDTDCDTIREDLMASYDRGVKSSARARKHMRECSGCREYRGALKGMRRSFAALSPIGAAGPLALVAKLFGLGSAGGGAAVTGGSAVVGSATACKVAAIVCTAAITAGGAAEVKKMTSDAPTKAKPAASRVVKARAGAAAAAPVAPKVFGEQPVVNARPAVPATRPAEAPAVVSPVVEAPALEAPAIALPAGPGGAVAPADDTAPQAPTQNQDGTTGTPQDTTSEPVGGSAQAPAEEPTQQSSPSGDGSPPPPEH